ncbi:BBE domain-containing protein [Thermocatellispora tengchongensis]
MPYAECGSIHADPDHPHAYAATNALLSRLAPEGLRALLEAAGPGSPVPCVVDIRHLGGALRKDGPAALGHREAEFAVRIISGHGPGGTGPDEVRDRLALARRALAPWTLGHNLAFLYGYGEEAGEAQSRAGYAPGAYERLAALKAAYDPGNMFRFNRNIPPAR